MSQLLANYDAARKAIFDHCGVPENERGGYIEIELNSWSINKLGKLVIIEADRELVFHELPLTIFRGTGFALAYVDVAGDEWHPERVWLALDNAMEVKP